MSQASSDKPHMALFWGCFIALITTAFAFITRAFLVNDPTLWPKAFGLDGVQAQQLFGAGIWPFAISIILFSLIIDRVGYKAAMWFSFICYALYAVLALQAHSVISADPTAKEKAYQFLYWGSVILGLGNGTVEAFINPVVATMFRTGKVKWTVPTPGRAKYEASPLVGDGKAIGGSDVLRKVKSVAQLAKSLKEWVLPENEGFDPAEANTVKIQPEGQPLPQERFRRLDD